MLKSLHLATLRRWGFLELRNGVITAILGTLSNENLDVPNVKNSNRKLIFSLLQCFDSKNSYSEALRSVVWDRNVPPSETSNFRLLFLTSGTSAFSLLKLTIGIPRQLNGSHGGVPKNPEARRRKEVQSKRVPVTFLPRPFLSISIFLRPLSI